LKHEPLVELVAAEACRRATPDDQHPWHTIDLISPQPIERLALNAPQAVGARRGP
jgi:hypothetical protein